MDTLFRLHQFLLSIGICTTVTLELPEGRHTYIGISAQEFQFGREGDILTTYVV